MPETQHPEAAMAAAGGGVSDYADDLPAMMRMVSRWSRAMQEPLRQAQIDQDMYDCFQWEDEEKAALRARGQPIITANRIKPAINGIVGVVDKGRTDPKAWPRTPNDEKSADLATDVLRYLSDANRLQDLKGESLTELLIWGWTGTITVVDSQGNTKIKRIRPEELIWDPASRQRDCSDAQFLGIAKWRYADDMKQEMPDHAADIDAALNADPTIDGGMPESAADRPDWFADREARRVLQVELYWKRQGDWHRAVFVRGAILQAGPSDYKTAEGFLRCPIEVQRAYIDRRNNPYGIVRDMRDAQRETNSRRSWLLFNLSARPFVYSSAAGIEDPDEFARQVASAAGRAMVNGSIAENIQFIDNSGRIQGQFELLAEAKAEIERQGPNPGVVGRDVQGQSGRAILAQQEAGLLELAPLLSGFNDFILRLYRQMWACQQQFGHPDLYVRVSDDTGAAKFTQTQVPVIGPDGMPVMVMGPNGQPQPQMKNVMAEADVDLVIDVSPDVAVIQQEQFQQLSQLIIAVAPLPQAAPAIPAMLEAMFANSSFRNKSQFIDALDQSQAPSPEQMMQKQLQMQGAQAEVAEKQASAQHKQGQAAHSNALAALTSLEAANLYKEDHRRDLGLDEAHKGHLLDVAQAQHQVMQGNRQHMLDVAALKLQQIAQEQSAREAPQNPPPG